MDILTSLVLLSVISLICVWIYLQDFTRKILIYKTINLTQVITSIVPTSLFVLFFTLSYISILSNSKVTNDSFLDNLVLLVLVLFIAFATLGVGIHFTGKCLSENLKNSRCKEVRKNTYFFHMVLGHHVTFVLGMLSLLLIAAFNLNHPASIPVSGSKTFLIILFGFLWALSWTFAFTFAPIEREIYLVLGWSSSAILMVLLSINGQPIYFFPYSIFFFSTIFFIAAMVTIIYAVEKIKNRHISLILFKEKVESELYIKYHQENI